MRRYSWEIEMDWDLFSKECNGRTWGDGHCMICPNLYACHTHPDDRSDDETDYGYNILAFSEPTETFDSNLSYEQFEVTRHNRHMIGYGLNRKNERYFYDYSGWEHIIPDTFEYNGVNYIVTRIGDGGFFHCDDLKVISVPHTVKSIGSQAFDECLKLEAIYIGKGLEQAERVFILCDKLRKIKIHKDNPYFCDVDGVMYSKDMKVLVRYPQDKIGEEYVVPDGVEKIGTLAFYGCEHLKSIVLPNSVKEIDEGAFWYCRKLVSVNIPDGVSILSKKIFMACKKLEKIDIPNSVEIIDDFAFEGCELIKSLKIPENVSIVGDFAFSNCVNLESINLPQGITKISKGLFNMCKSLTSLELPFNVDFIGDFAFSDCPFTFLSLPKSVLFIGKDAFNFCSNLSYLTYEGYLRDWEKIEKSDGWDRIGYHETGIRVKCK